MPADRLTPWIPTLCAAAAVGAAAGLVVWHTDLARRALAQHGSPGVTEPRAGHERTVTEARVLRTLAALRLVTVEVHTQVTATVADESWRGDSRATVSVPARLLYGCDLALARVERTGRGWPAPTLTVTVPPPERLGSEVVTHRETADLSLGWLRLRSAAGERLLGLARRSLWQAAQDSALDPDHAQLVRAMARRQIAQLVTRLIEHDPAHDEPPDAPAPRSGTVSVAVVFTDETAPP
ncbi:MAG: hypothetical protein C0468_04530 [Planctomyces sp.]|nr:hypothetical protein [Planctomyces sp.]